MLQDEVQRLKETCKMQMVQSLNTLDEVVEQLENPFFVLKDRDIMNYYALNVEIYSNLQGIELQW